jgi:hypothetical protein
VSAESELAFLRSLPPEVIRFLRLVRRGFPGAKLVKFIPKGTAAESILAPRGAA